MQALIATADGIRRLDGAAEPALRGHDVAALGRARSGDGWWAVVDARALWRGDAAGDSWEAVAELPGGDRATCVVDAAGSVLVGTTGAHLYRLVDRALEPVDEFEKADSRDDWYTPWGGPADVRSLDGSGSTLLVNVHVGGILRSDDGGRSWRPTIDIHADVHQVVAPADGLPAVAAAAVGVAISHDDGITWSVERDGMHATYSRAVTIADGVIVASASTGPGGGRSCLYRRSLAGSAFERCAGGLPEWFADNVDTGWLDAVGREVVCGAPDGSVWLSPDAGVTWEQAGLRLPPIRCVRAC